MRFSMAGGRRRWALGGAGIVALVVIVVAVALWDSGDQLSRAEFIAEGDEICARASDAFGELQSEPPRTAREAAELTERLIGIAEDERDAIDDLNQPSELDEEVDRYLEARNEGIDLLREGLEAAETGESRRYQAAQAELGRGQRPRRRLAREIGFRQCSKPLPPAG